ncbi:MAG TPA: OmpA family protein [Rhodanobacteraceae bacterium]
MPAIAQQARPEFVVAKPTVAHLWLHVASQKVADLQPGTKVDVIDKDGDWLWVIVPPDAHGTRRSGWVRANTVEMVPIPPVAALSTDARQELAAPAAEPAASTEDKVTISVSETHGDMSSSAPAAAAAVTTFDDVHFDRNRSALRQEDTDTLQKMVAALKADPSLVVDIEGHTCNLGTAAYNRTLGLRRARAVKDYLVSAGIEANRLRTVTKGEADPQYDNSHEETRKLNRRVALVPEPRR